MFRLSLGNALSAVAGFAIVAASALNAVLPDGVFSVVGLLLLGGFGLMATAWLWRLRVASKHRRELQEFADRVGWVYRERTLDYVGAFRSYPFARGDEREDLDVLSGTFQGYVCSTFTHAYKDQNDERSLPQTYEFQVTMVQLPVAYPTIDLLPDDLLAKAAKMVGGMDVNFESAAFNRRWRVKGPDAKYVHAMITPRVMRRLVQEDTQGLALRIEGRYLMCWRAGREGSENLAQRFGMLTSIAKALPPHMERQMREAAARRVAGEEAREAGAPAWARTPRALTSGYKARMAHGGHGWVAPATEVPPTEAPPPST